MTLTPQSLASLSKCKESHRVPNIGPMKRIGGRLTLSKFVVVEYVTLSFEWFAVSGSHRAWWKCFAHIVRIAWSSCEEEVIAIKICNSTERRGDGLSLDKSRILLSDLLSAHGLWWGFSSRTVRRFYSKKPSEEHQRTGDLFFLEITP